MELNGHLLQPNQFLINKKCCWLSWFGVHWIANAVSCFLLLAVHTENISIELFVLDLQMAPVVIVLVSDGSRCLLARQAVFPPGMYSALSDFCDMGESHFITSCCPHHISLWGYLTILLLYQLCFILQESLWRKPCTERWQKRWVWRWRTYSILDHSTGHSHKAPLC